MKKTNRTLTIDVPAQPTNKRLYVYDSTWLNTELTNMIKQLQDRPEICTKAELFATQNYTYKMFVWRLKSTKALEDINGKPSKTKQLMDKLEEILEARLVNRGLTAKNFPFIIFLLKNHYGYQDKREVETETTHVFKVARGNTPLKSATKTNRLKVVNKVVDSKVSKGNK
jgi:hypothetical protein